ncbi:MAG: sigma-70 family RNA polymerase sigma factor [Verrucomicrobiota bacterium]
MATDDGDGHTEDRPQPLFVTTHWSVVLAAGHGDTTSADDALAHLCQTYWYPLYAYARRRGCSPPDAQDLTQEFFARLLKGNWLAEADRQRGRFRSFLLSAMKHFMANEWNKAQAQKRGGGQPILSLNDDSAEYRYRLEPAEKATPESLFERGWALTLLEGVLARLEEEYRQEGKHTWMEAMRPALTTDRGAIDYAQMAHKLGVTETAARVAVHRLRQRYRQLIRSEVASTVASPEEVEAEMRHLFQVLTNS